MHAIWNLPIDSAAVAFKLLMGLQDPLKALSALTLLSILMLCCMAQSLSQRRLLTLWMMSSISLVVWTICVTLLHYSGVT